MLLLRNAGVSFTVVVITSLKICYTRVIQVAMSAVGEDVLNEKLLRLKNSRSGHLSTVTARLNEIDALLSNENIDLVKEKLTDFTAAFEAFKEAHIFYLSYVEDETCIARCQESFDREVVRRDDFSRRVQEWIVRTEEAIRLNSQVSPDDSASNGGFRFASKSSRRPGRSSCSRGSRESSCSSLSVVRAKEAARIAELKAEAAVFKKRQFLEEQRFRLKQEEKLLSLETEIAKSQAREQALASVVDPNSRVVLPSPGFMDPDPHLAAADPDKVDANRPLAVPNPASTESNPRLIVPSPVTLETSHPGRTSSAPVAQGHSTMNPEAQEWPQRLLVTNNDGSLSGSNQSGALSSPSERAFHEMLELHQHQNALQRQQNKIVEMLATQQKKSSLPHPKVPIFDGSPMEYGPFIRAFENIIESKTSSSSERLYYLEQFTSGDVKELVRSCQFLPPDRGYPEAKRLMKKKFGNDFRVVAAYESKALNWPEVKAEDAVGLNRFSLFLMRCKNAMEGSGHLTKLEQPDTVRKLVLKLPFNLRVRWRRLVDDIMNTETRAIRFRDFVEFVDHEARVVTNPVFGSIVEDTKPKLDRRDGRLQKGSLTKRAGELSFAVQVGSSQNAPTGFAPARGTPPSVGEVSCLYCQAGHTLENCISLRNRPYMDRIEFLKSKGLCFGCLSSDHAAKNCPGRKSCTFPNCTKKHPAVLHTNSVARKQQAENPPANPSAREGVARVQNALVNPDGKIKTANNECLSRTGMAVVPVKVWIKGSKTPTVTYAFLDSGSSSTFCTETLMRQLGVSGTKTTISLTTLEKKDSLVDSFVVTDLTISDLDENVFIDLPTLYTRPSIPVSREDIPTQDDVDKWPHLSGVHLPKVDAEIGLLIASDVPKVLDPLK